MRHLVLTTTLMVGSATAHAQSARPTVTPVLVDRVVAVVDESPLLLSEVRRLVMRTGTPKTTERKALHAAYRAALETLIERRLIEVAARRKGVTVSRDQVDAALKRIADDASMTPQELLARVTDAGWTEAEYRRDLEAQLREWMTLTTVASERGDELDTPPKREEAKQRWLAQLKRDVWLERRWRP